MILNFYFHEFHICGFIIQVRETLSKELTSCRKKLEKQSEQFHSLEQTKKLAFQQHSLYEQEIQSLEKQLQTLKRVHVLLKYLAFINI